MKPILMNVSAIAVSLCLIVAVSCKKESLKSQSKTKGYVSIQLFQDEKMLETNSSLKVTNVNEFAVEIYDKNNNLLKSYNKLSSVPSSIELDKGEYYVTAFSTNTTKATFDNPTYFGQSNHFVIAGGDSQLASIKCYISNVKVSIVYSDTVKSKFYDYNVLVYNQTDTLLYGKDDKREGYFPAGNLSVEAHLFYKKIDGTTDEKVLHGSIVSAKAMKHYQLEVDASILKGTSSIQVTAIDSTATEIVKITDSTIVVTSKTVAELVAGNLLLTEVMADPDIISDTYGEWIEIYNNATFPININGLIVKVGIKSYSVTVNHEMQAGDYVFLCKDAQGGAGALVYYGSALSLVNTTGSIQLLSGDGVTEIASMSYATTTTGASLSLDPTKMTYTLAKDPSSWCTATQVYSTGDKGTPGLVNSACN